VTAADFVRGRFDNHVLALAIALTGLLRAYPISRCSLSASRSLSQGLVSTLLSVPAERISSCRSSSPSLFSRLNTYTSGLRASAMISIVKIVLVYGTVIAAIVVIPAEPGRLRAYFCKYGSG